MLAEDPLKFLPLDRRQQDLGRLHLLLDGNVYRSPVVSVWVLAFLRGVCARGQVFRITGSERVILVTGGGGLASSQASSDGVVLL